MARVPPSLLCYVCALTVACASRACQRRARSACQARCRRRRRADAATPPRVSLHSRLLQEVIASQNCTYGFDAAALKQQLKDAWGVDVWLTCNPE